MADQRSPTRTDDISVLNLVTSKDSEFFIQQVNALEDLGVAHRTIPVPGRHRTRTEVETRSVTDYVKFFRLVRRQSLDQFDLIHANYGLTAPAAISQRQIPVVLSLWGGDLFGRFSPITKIAATMCDAVIVMSDEMADELTIPAFVIPHGVDIDRFHPMDRTSAQEFVGWDPDDVHVFFPYPTTRSVKDYPRAQRIIAAAQNRFDTRIRLQTTGGTVPHSEMPVYMNAADALLLTSKREGSPNTVKEALACDVPVVSTDVGDVRERLHDVNPSIVSDRDRDLIEGLVRIIDAGRRSNGHRQVEEISTEAMAEQIFEVYSTILR